MINFCGLKEQYKSIKSEIDNAIKETLESSVFIGGKKIAELEEKFSILHGVKYCATTSSGTSAIFCALKCLGIGPGDEVIVPVNTFIATAEAVVLTGAKVVFCDIDENTYCINIQKAKNLITKNTQCIIAVNMYGYMANVKELKRITDEYKIYFIEDSAQAHLGNGTGKYSTCACFSFFPTKNLGCYGDGGAVISNDKMLIDKIRSFANHGRLLDKYIHFSNGFNFRMDSIQASILLVKLKYLREWTLSRIYNACQYSKQLKNIVKTPILKNNVFHLYVIQTDNPEDLMAYLDKNNVKTFIHYPIPLHLQPAYTWMGHKIGDFPIAEIIAKRILSLPMFPELTKKNIDMVCKLIKRFLCK